MLIEDGKIIANALLRDMNFINRLAVKITNTVEDSLVGMISIEDARDATQREALLWERDAIARVRAACPACDNGYIQDGPDSSYECDVCGTFVRAIQGDEG